MTLARDLQLGRLRGLSGPPRGKDLEGARVYTSDQTHFSIARALDELGFPTDTLVVLPADDDFHLRGAPVAEAVARDRAAGLTPFAIAAVAGSTNTGSVDADRRAGRRRRGARACGSTSTRPTAAARGCPRATRPGPGPRARRLGHGRPAQVVLPGLRHRRAARPRRRGPRRGLRRPRAGVLPRRRDAGRRARGRHARTTSGTATHADDHGDQLNFYKLSFEGTRRWRALKLWMTWKHLGTTGFGRLIEANDDLAAYLARRCAEADDFEALPAVPELSVVCFRHVPGGAARLTPAALDAHQDRLQAALEASGDGWLTTTRLRGATWLRAGIVNYLVDRGRHRPAARHAAGASPVTVPTPRVSGRAAPRGWRWPPAVAADSRCSVPVAPCDVDDRRDRRHQLTSRAAPGGRRDRLVHRRGHRPARLGRDRGRQRAAPAVDLRLKPEAAERFAEHTGTPTSVAFLAIAVNGVVVVGADASTAPIEGGRRHHHRGGHGRRLVEAIRPCLPSRSAPPG